MPNAVRDDSPYGRLLNKIEANRRRQRIVSGLQELDSASSEARLREVVERYPELMTDEAEQFIAERLESAATEADLRFFNSNRELVRLIRRGDLARAWSLRDEASRIFMEEVVVPLTREFESARFRAPSRLKALLGLELLSVIPPGDKPELQADVGFELAADAAEQLSNATTAATLRRSLAVERRTEHQEGSTDFRHAASALAGAGRFRQASVAVESGRARELGLLTLTQRLDLDRLSHHDPTLRAAVEEWGASVRSDSLGSDERPASDRLEHLESGRSAIQQVPTLRAAIRPPNLAEISDAVQPGCPLVYLVAGPQDSHAIMVDKKESGHLELEAIRAPDCDSHVIAVLALSRFRRLNRQATPPSFVDTQALGPEWHDAYVTESTSLVGEQLLRPLAELLTSRGASGVTLVPAGLFGLMPLHSIAWDDSTGNRRYLIDDFDVTFAPSARLHVVCRQRARSQVGGTTRFLGIANPLPHSSPLPGSKIEIELVQDLVPADDILILQDEQATKQRVLDALPSATYVHLACHARAHFFDPLHSAAFSLSGEEELSVLEIARLKIPARLVVASACGTGVVQGYDEIDEWFSLATAFIAAGAAGVAATFWPIPDYATALLVSKFYQVMFLADKPPATALREAQLWIRDADRIAIDAYVSTRPSLRALRDSRSTSFASSESAPFSAPSNWAAFFYTGA